MRFGRWVGMTLSISEDFLAGNTTAGKIRRFKGNVIRASAETPSLKEQSITEVKTAQFRQFMKDTGVDIIE